MKTVFEDSDQNIFCQAFPVTFFSTVSHPLSDIMDLHHQSSVMCIFMLGVEDTHPWSATKVGNPIPATIPEDQYQKNNQQTTHTSHYPSRPVEIFL